MLVLRVLGMLDMLLIAVGLAADGLGRQRARETVHGVGVGHRADSARCDRACRAWSLFVGEEEMVEEEQNVNLAHRKTIVGNLKVKYRRGGR